MLTMPVALFTAPSMDEFGIGRPKHSMEIFVASTVKTFWDGLAFSFSRTVFGSLLVLMTNTASSFAPSATLIGVDERRIHDRHHARIQHRAVHPERPFR